MADRFRGFLPVVVDVETGGFNCKTDALLEIAAEADAEAAQAARDALETLPGDGVDDEIAARLGEAKGPVREVLIELVGEAARLAAEIDGTTTSLLACHQDQVVVAPPEATIWSTSDYCPIAGMTIGAEQGIVGRSVQENVCQIVRDASLDSASASQGLSAN